MHKLFLCLRYLRKRRIAWFPAAAVMLCVALLIVVTSLFHGFVDSYLSYSARVFGQVVLTPPRPMAQYREAAAYLAQLPCVANATPVVRTGALLYLGRGDVRAVQLLGIDLAARCRDEGFRRGLVLQGSDDARPTFALSSPAKQNARAWLEGKRKRQVADDELPVGVVLGIGLLAQPNELTDEYDTDAVIENIRSRRQGLVITTAKLASAPSDQDNAVPSKSQGICWLVDVVQTGLHEADTNFAYLPFDYVASLIGTPGPDGRAYCTAEIQLTAADGFDAKAVVGEVAQAWRNFARDRLNWPEPLIDDTVVMANAQSYWTRLYTREIEKQLGMLQMMLGLICLVVVTLVFVVLFMIVMHKRRDVGIVRSLGSSRSGVAMIFLGYGGGIGLVGAALGLGLGVAATRNINVIEAILTRLLGLKVWKSGVYMFQQIPNQVAWRSVWWILLVGVALAVLGAVLPALRAARLQPADALRYE